jgi:hypothetical protein
MSLHIYDSTMLWEQRTGNAQSGTFLVFSILDMQNLQHILGILLNGDGEVNV